MGDNNTVVDKFVFRLATSFIGAVVLIITGAMAYVMVRDGNSQEVTTVTGALGWMGAAGVIVLAFLVGAAKMVEGQLSGVLGALGGGPTAPAAPAAAPAPVAAEPAPGA